MHVFARDVPGDPNSVDAFQGSEASMICQTAIERRQTSLEPGASVDIYGDVIIAGGVMNCADFVGAAYIFTRDQSGEPSSADACDR